ncbi:MAG: hypothetical protein ACFFA6_09875 [Promethearchaeota archaeon]
MNEEEDIPNKVEKELGFENCNIEKLAAKSLGIFQDKEIDKFELECENTYKDQYKCKGEYNKGTRSLHKIDCEKL